MRLKFDVKETKLLKADRDKFYKLLDLVKTNDESRLILTVEKGLHTCFIRLVRAALGGLPRERLADFLDVSDKTASRWESSRVLTLPRSSADRAIRLLQLRQKAIDVFEDEDDALAWMNEPNDVFDGRRPIEHAHTEIGCRQVERVLTRIDHGVFS